MANRLLKAYHKSVSWSPTAVGDTETRAALAVKAGERVIAVSVRVNTPSAASSAVTMQVGDGADVDGFVAAFDPEQAAGTLIDGAGAYLATSGGKLYTAADTIDVVYTVTTAGATNPSITVKATIIKEW